MSTNAALTLLAAAHFACHYFLLIYPTAALAIAREETDSYGAALAAGSSIYIAFALATPLAGWLGDRFRGDRLIALQFLGLGASAIGAALAPEAITLQVSLVCLGVFAAIFHPIGLAMVTRLARKHGQALAVNGVFGNLGLAGAALFTGVLAEAYGWRTAFLVPGLVAIIIGAIALIWARAPLRETDSTQLTRSPTPRDAQMIVLAIVFAAALFGGFAFNGVTISLPRLLEERLSIWVPSLTDIGAVTAAIFALAAFAQLPVGALLDRFGGRPVLLVTYSLQAVALAALALTEGAATAAVALFATTLLFASIPISGWLLGRYIAPDWRSRAFAAEYVLSLGVGASAAPVIATLHGAGIGFDAQYLGVALSVAMISLLALASPRRFGADQAA